MCTPARLAKRAKRRKRASARRSPSHSTTLARCLAMHIVTLYQRRPSGCKHATVVRLQPLADR